MVVFENTVERENNASDQHSFLFQQVLQCISKTSTNWINPDFSSAILEYYCLEFCFMEKNYNQTLIFPPVIINQMKSPSNNDTSSKSSND